MPARIISISGRNVIFDDGEYVEFTIMYQEASRRYNSARVLGSAEELRLVVADIQEKGSGWQDLNPVENLRLQVMR